MRDWLMQLLMMRSPVICCLLAGGPGKLVVPYESKPKGLRTRGASGVSARLKARELGAPTLIAEEDAYPSSSREHPSCTFLLYPGPQQIGWGPPALVRMLFAQLTGSSANLLETPSQTYLEIMFYQLSGHSQSSQADTQN